MELDAVFAFNDVLRSNTSRPSGRVRVGAAWVAAGAGGTEVGGRSAMPLLTWCMLPQRSAVHRSLSLLADCVQTLYEPLPLLSA